MKTKPYFIARETVSGCSFTTLLPYDKKLEKINKTTRKCLEMPAFSEFRLKGT